MNFFQIQEIIIENFQIQEVIIEKYEKDVLNLLMQNVIVHVLLICFISELCNKIFGARTIFYLQK